MPITRKQKEEAVTKLAEKFSQSKSVVLTDYQGLTMKHLSDLRNKLADQQAEFTVAKNTLISRALKEANYADSPQEEGPTAVLFSYEDEVSPIKILVKALKDAGIGKIKLGFLDKELLDGTAVTRLAALPGKQELRGQVVGTLAAPLQGIVGVLQANLRNFVYALDQIRIQKGGE